MSKKKQTMSELIAHERTSSRRMTVDVEGRLRVSSGDKTYPRCDVGGEFVI